MSTTGAASAAACSPQVLAESFVMDVAGVLHRFGTPADRLEHALEGITDQLGLCGQFLVTPTSVTACFADASGNRFYLIRGEQQDANLAKLSQLEKLADQVGAGQMAVAEATRKVRAILAAPDRYSQPAVVLAFALTSAAVARLLHGGLPEVLVGGSIGLCLAIALSVAGRWPRLRHVLLLLVAIGTAVLAAAGAQLLGGALSQTTATLAGLIVLLPGLTATLALNELATGNLVSGTARLAGAMVKFMQLGFGVALGTRLGALLFTPGPDTLLSHGRGLGEWAALVVAALGLAVILQVQRREVGWVLFGALVGLAALRLGEQALGTELSPLLAAFAVTLTSNAYARWAGRTASVIEVPALLLLVPGSVGYRSVAALWHQDVLVGMQTAFAMGLNATALVAGTLLAGLLLPPRAAKRPSAVATQPT